VSINPNGELNSYHPEEPERAPEDASAARETAGDPHCAVAMLSELLVPGALKPLNREVLDYWLTIRRDQRIPTRAMFDPKQIPRALSHLCILDVLPGQDSILRLVGTAISTLLGRDLTGVSLKTLTPAADWEYRIAAFQRVLDGEAFVGKHIFPLTSGAQVISQELILPFSDRRENGSQQLLVSNDFALPRFKDETNADNSELKLTREDRFYSL
jgi:hypothetical protein